MKDFGRGTGKYSYSTWTHQQTLVSSVVLAHCIDEVVSKMADFLPSRSLLSVCFPNCLLTSGEVEQLRKSKEIDKCINRDKTYVKRLVKILLLGAGESGKSTFLKQMRIIHGQDFDQRAKEEFRATIFSNVIKGEPVLIIYYLIFWNELALVLCGGHGEVLNGKFGVMLATADWRGHFTVLDKASANVVSYRSKKRPCYLCLFIWWHRIDCIHACICVYPSCMYFPLSFYSKVTDTVYSGLTLSQVFSSWLLLAWLIYMGKHETIISYEMFSFTVNRPIKQYSHWVLSA